MSRDLTGSKASKERDGRGQRLGATAAEEMSIGAKTELYFFVESISENNHKEHQ